MAKTFYTNGTGSQQTLTPSQNEKVAVYQTLADAEADLANLEAGQIVATPDTGDENAQPVDVVESGNMHAVTSNAVATSNAMPVNEVTANNLHSVTSNAVAEAFDNIKELLIPRNRLTNLNNAVNLHKNNKIVLYSTNFQPSNMPANTSNYWWGFVYNHPEVTQFIIQVAFTFHFTHCYSRIYNTSTQTFGDWSTLF